VCQFEKELHTGVDACQKMIDFATPVLERAVADAGDCNAMQEDGEGSSQKKIDSVVGTNRIPLSIY